MSEPLKAGREMDALVAEKVMGLEIHSLAWPVQYYSHDESWEVAPEDWGTKQPGRWGTQRDVVWKHRGTNIHGKEYSSLHRVPDYSTEIADAWLVVDHFSNARFSQRLAFAKALQYGVVRDGEVISWPWALMLLTAEELCHAALQAVGGLPGAEG